MMKKISIVLQTEEAIDETMDARTASQNTSLVSQPNQFPDCACHLRIVTLSTLSLKITEPTFAKSPMTQHFRPAKEFVVPENKTE